jgi:hypothetical protein
MKPATMAVRVLVLPAALLASCQLWAQASSSDAANAQAAASADAAGSFATAALASGTTFQAALAQPLDSGKCRAGDTITAHTTEAVSSNGKVVIPKGTKLIGHVTQVKAKTHDSATSSLGIVFDRAELKGGGEMPLHVGIQAIAAAQDSAAASADDFGAMGSPGAMTGAGMSRGGGGGLGVGGVAGSAVGATGGIAGAAGSTAGATAGVAGSAAGAAGGTVRGVGGAGATLSANDSGTGVIGLRGLSLDAAGSTSAQGSVVTGTGRNVHLNSGTTFVLRAEAQ